MYAQAWSHDFPSLASSEECEIEFGGAYPFHCHQFELGCGFDIAKFTSLRDQEYHKCCGGFPVLKLKVIEIWKRVQEC